jgi:hypothetical protein
MLVLHVKLLRLTSITLRHCFDLSIGQLEQAFARPCCGMLELSDDPPYSIPRNYYLQIGLDIRALLCYHNKDLHFICLLSLDDSVHIDNGDGKERAYAPRDE